MKSYGSLRNPFKKCINLIHVEMQITFRLDYNTGEMYERLLDFYVHS